MDELTQAHYQGITARAQAHIWVSDSTGNFKFKTIKFKYVDLRVHGKKLTPIMANSSKKDTGKLRRTTQNGRRQIPSSNETKRVES